MGSLIHSRPGSRDIASWDTGVSLYGIRGWRCLRAHDPESPPPSVRCTTEHRRRGPVTTASPAPCPRFGLSDRLPPSAGLLLNRVLTTACPECRGSGPGRALSIEPAALTSSLQQYLRRCLTRGVGSDKNCNSRAGLCDEAIGIDLRPRAESDRAALPPCRLRYYVEVSSFFEALLRRLGAIDR